MPFRTVSNRFCCAYLPQPLEITRPHRKHKITVDCRFVTEPCDANFARAIQRFTNANCSFISLITHIIFAKPLHTFARYVQIKNPGVSPGFERKAEAVVISGARMPEFPDDRHLASALAAADGRADPDLPEPGAVAPAPRAVWRSQNVQRAHAPEQE